MPRIFLKYLLLPLFLFFFSGPIAGAFAKSMPQYNRLTFIRFTATVESVNTLKNPNIGRMGLHIFAKDAADTLYLVHICPQWYADKYPELFAFHKGDQLIISGSRFATKLTENNVFAATIINCSQDNAQLDIRNPLTGIPLWNNRPKNLFGKIQQIQQQVFRDNSRYIQENVAKNIARFQARQINLLHLQQ
jgi:hypothetical protein